jgi:preprotein translocase subunit SecD
VFRRGRPRPRGSGRVGSSTAARDDDGAAARPASADASRSPASAAGASPAAASPAVAFASPSAAPTAAASASAGRAASAVAAPSAASTSSASAAAGLDADYAELQLRDDRRRPSAVGIALVRRRDDDQRCRLDHRLELVERGRAYR